MKELFNIVLSLFKKKLITVIEDQRSEEEKQKDWAITKNRKFVSAMSRYNKNQIDIWGNERIDESIYADENQYRTSSCVAHGVGTATEEAGCHRPSHLLFYRTRSNYPEPGCVPHEMVDRAAKFHLPKWEEMPTPVGATEKFANSLKVPTLRKRRHKLDYYDVLKSKYGNGDSIASASYLGCMPTITIFASSKEWFKKYVHISDHNLGRWGADVRHQVDVLANSGFTENGVKYVAVVDSSYSSDDNTIRYVSKDFLDKRVYHAYSYIK